MRKFRFAVFMLAGVLVLGAVVLTGAVQELQAQEQEKTVWDAGAVTSLVCNTEEMKALLEKDEKVRVCVVNAVAQAQTTRQMVIQKMLTNMTVREKIMEQIAKHPELRKQMQGKLLEIQVQGSGTK